MRRVIFAGVALLILLGVGVALLGPRISGAMAPMVVGALTRGRLAGELAVSDVHLSWKGPQTIGALELRDAHGAVVATGAVEASANLLSSIFGSRDLGDITLQGRVNLPDALAALRQSTGKTPSGGGATVGGAPGASTTTSSPAGSGAISLSPFVTNANITLDGVTVVFTSGADQRDDSAAGLKDIAGKIEFAVGAPITVALDASSLTGAGGVSLTATIDGLTDATGALTTSAARVDANLKGTMAPEQLASITNALGFRAADGAPDEFTSGPVTFAMAYKGGAQAGRGSFTINGEESGKTPLLAHATVDYADGRIKLSEPATFSAPISQRVLDRLVGPDQAGRVTIDEPIGVTVEIKSLDVPAPTRGALDLRGASLNMEIQTTEAVGRIALVSGDAGAPESNSFRVAPATFTIEAPDLDGPIALRASTRAAFKHTAAGELSLDLHASDLLDENGSYRGGLPALRGDVAVVGASTDLLQPFVDRFGIDLPQTFGATIDARLQARAGGSSSSRDSQEHTTDLVFSMDTARLSAHGQASVDSDQIRTSGDGIVIDVQSAGAVLDSVFSAMAPGAEAQFTGEGSVRLAISGLAVPLAGRSVRLDRSRADVSIEAGGFSVQPSPDAPTIDAKALAFSLSLTPDEQPRAHLSATLADAGRSFEVRGDVTAPDLFGSDGSIDLAHAHMTGSARLSGLPTTTLASLAHLSDEDTDLLARGAGATINTSITVLPSADDASTLFTVTAAGEQNFLTNMSFRVTPGVEIRVEDGALSAVVRPDLAARVVRRFAPDLESPPQLASPARMSLTLKSVAIPFDAAGELDLSATPPVQATLEVKNDLLFTGVPVGGATTVDAGLRHVRATVSFDPAQSRSGSVEIHSELFDPRAPRQPIGALHANALVTNGSLDAEASVEQIDTHRLDALLGKPDLFELSIGSPASVSLTTSRKSAADPMIVEIGVKSPRLTTKARVRADSDHVELTAPTQAHWTMDERWASRYVLPTPDGSEPRLRIVGPTAMNLSIKRASFGVGGAPMKPGVFDLEMHASAPTLTLEAPGGVATRRRDVVFDVASQPEPGVIEYRAAMNSDDPALAPFQMQGRIAHLADDSGALTPERAAVTFKATGDLPTPLIDALAQAGGIIAEALGPTVALRAQSDRFSREGGSLVASASSSRADATIAGFVRHGAFYTDGHSRITLTTITPELGELVFQQIFPMIGSIEKKPPDSPATIDAVALVLPIDNDMTKLSGTLSVNLGHVRYSASPFFATMLTATNNNPDAMLPADWPPLKITIDHGVVRYDRVKLPLGALTFDTEGEVDLVRRHANIIVYVPFFALMDQVSNVAARVPGVSGDTLIPIRMKGPLGSLKAEPAIDLLPNELFKHPENIIKGFLKKRILPH